MLKNSVSNKMLHGGDYNPDQWLDQPEILAEDLKLMKLAHTNAFSVGIFAWAAIEPQEGVFKFEWLDKIMDDLAANGAKVALATPSGARPAWMSKKYPEVLRTTGKREKNLHGARHNHCFSSPVYREKVSIMNRKLASATKTTRLCLCGMCPMNTGASAIAIIASRHFGSGCKRNIRHWKR